MLTEEKKRQRALALAARAALTPQAREEKSRAICAALLALIEKAGVRTVFSYMPYGGEADVTMLNSELTRRGLRLCFPAWDGRGGMEALAPQGQDAWETGEYGILRPKRELSALVPPEEIELIVTPCVAFDAERRRLGHGAGYYDRYIPRTRAVTLGAAFEAQRLPRIATGETDIPLSAFVSEERVY